MENGTPPVTRLADARWMASALRLARKAIGRTAPNPMVGAIVIKHGRLVGAGYHRKAGSPHAEIEAIRRASAKARGATLYSTLEPCNHTGRTPPCCDAILKAGIARVVVAAVDPNPITNGRGIVRLRRAGLRVVTGVLRDEADALNAPFRKAMVSHLPHTIAKIGQSLDGKIATRLGESRWITSPSSRRLAHRLRREVDAILVGVNTVLRDDPQLTARGVRARHGRPVRVIVDSRLRIPVTARCLRSSGAPAVIATTVRVHPNLARLRARGVEVICLPAQRMRVPLRRLFSILARRGIHSVLIEGGGEVLASALAERLVDRIVWCIAPILIGGRTAPGSVGGDGSRRLSHAIRIQDLNCHRVGPDLCVEGRVVYPKSVRGFSEFAGSRVRQSTRQPANPPTR